MSLFGYNYKKSGSGVSKDEPTKKSFFRFWEIYFKKFGKLILLNLVTFLFCIPIVTIGPAIAGMTRVLRDYSTGKSIFMMHEFMKGFKDNWKQSLPIGILNVIICASAALAFRVYPQLAAADAGNDTLYTVLTVITISLAFTFFVMNFYIYPMIIATDLSLKNILKNSFFLTCLALMKNIGTLILVGLVAVSTGLLCYLMPFFLILIPFFSFSFIGHIIVFNTYPVIQKFVIDPYYEERGEVNPEYTRYTTGTDESLFLDKGGDELPVDLNENKKNKVIK